MGVEVKGAGDGVVIAERGCNDGCGCRDHSGWDSGWGAVGDAQRDQNIINQVVAALKTTGGTTTA